MTIFCPRESQVNGVNGLMIPSILVKRGAQSMLLPLARGILIHSLKGIAQQIVSSEAGILIWSAECLCKTVKLACTHYMLTV